MKLTSFLSAALVLASTALPAAADLTKAEAGGLIVPKPEYTKFNDALLYPKPKLKIPGIGPWCLSCPPDALKDHGKTLVIPHGR